ncbi:hypothetical protein B0A75_16860 [Flavobacterium oncorhynchi]|uniref:Uncharacterized protein n=1 Tax=Flavobacterium oncorhynchi TaxID=728056 RepID=A0A226HTC6_9FLAO|nr:hypothetical protein [Flavobacterium oncorhynchi]OXA97384.1 hypothetical protein B0A75_16860 [Flavobacterium oncorhynchi]
MEKKHIPFLSFLLLFLVATPFESGFTIQNPGWNTVIPSTSYLEIIVWSILLVILITYWIILRKGKVISFKIFAIHFILCIPFVFYARFNMFIRMTTVENSKDILEFITLLDIVAYTSLLLFLLSQIIFIVYIIKNKR